MSGTPYQRVLDAVLTDAGYLPEPLITDEAIQLRRTPSGHRTRGQQRGPAASAGEESQDVDWT